MLQLPVELKLMIVRQLPCDDLLSLLTVCRELKALVHPLFYDHLRFAKAGFAFPHAPNPYPFLDISNLQVPNPVSNKERAGIQNRVRTITIPCHPHDTCVGWERLQEPRSVTVKAEVLTIELAFPCQNGIAECHDPVCRHNCDKCKSYSYHHYDHPDDGGHPFPTCKFFDGLAFLPELAKSASRFVVALEPHNFKVSRFRDERYPYFDDPEDDCPHGHAGAKKLMAIIPSNVTDITLVFKTISPEIEWAPNCKHHDTGWYEEGCPSCPCGCDASQVGSTKQQSCWQSDLWLQLATAVAASRARVTIVNYSSIIPEGVKREDAFKGLKRGKRYTVRQQFLTLLRKAHKSQEEYEARLKDVHLVSMESWIRSGPWEDVFKRSELSGWFDHIANSGKPNKGSTKNKSKATGSKGDKPAKSAAASRTR
ncbi:hypothetical protein A1Q1_03465 [Trichosporon asahii var. asahii CBS 2479]|uniref:F-box domain-containing protein n=1 Tax=Trichosporon asahii var. asahii (strain ATCC 90039 / CBS 2479 / JCM 2466 / KCTC 7840 / NBRC 103889/ NCYC 2677 / UAMH 7654) TaxID=1186058 RepID=J5QJM4_TRIAS|nr:hypothetical protein A1Q1_03465 [Trichosporon asahii var. asahii CBS 2479]EJT47688.1 hypothetical protein A1Q1_03465 [Trichosporon asahii var. asahii CBS 2479]